MNLDAEHNVRLIWRLFTMSTSTKFGFQTTDGAPEQFVREMGKIQKTDR